MKWILRFIFSSLFIAVNLAADSAPEVPGKFSVNQQDNGQWLVEFSGDDFYVSSYFPQLPTFYNQTANNVIEDPLIQLSLMIGKNSQISMDEIVKMILSQISDEYKRIGIAITDKKISDPKEFKLAGNSRHFQQIVLDLSNGFREFVTINVFRGPKNEVISLSRFTLSDSEKDDLEFRLKGNAITSDFHGGTEVKFSPLPDKSQTSSLRATNNN